MIVQSWIDNIANILGYAFFQRALLVSLLAAIPCAIIGTYIVVKRISMITGSISHATFGGLGMAYFLGINPLIGALLFGTATGLSIGAFQRRAKNRLDTILSFLWAFGMALGLVFIYLTPGYSTDLFTYLFGNIFLISKVEMWSIVVINFIVVIVISLTSQSLKLVLFDEEFSEVRNMPILKINMLFYALVALTIIVILQLVGLILLIAFLTLPAASALFYQKTMKKVMILAGILIAVSNSLGLILGHLLDVPPGPIIILLLAMIYLVSLSVDWMKDRYKKANADIISHACELELNSFGMFDKYIAKSESSEPSPQTNQSYDLDEKLL